MAQAAVLRGLDLASAVALAGLGVMSSGLLIRSTTATTSTTTIMGGRCGAG
ncbi:hypothetical protein L2D01_11535 [Hyphomonadaceae bacterium ML37]|nr:hypothetical protein L2D01_11535 [Hyphomonadaceae bacterium ML37]